MNQEKVKLEFSKKLAIWVLSVYGLFLFVVVGLNSFVSSIIPVVDIIKATIIIPSIIITYYFAKSGIENVLVKLPYYFNSEKKAEITEEDPEGQ